MKNIATFATLVLIAALTLSGCHKSSNKDGDNLTLYTLLNNASNTACGDSYGLSQFSYPLAKVSKGQTVPFSTTYIAKDGKYEGTIMFTVNPGDVITVSAPAGTFNILKGSCPISTTNVPITPVSVSDFNPSGPTVNSAFTTLNAGTYVVLFKQGGTQSTNNTVQIQ
ncbi:hypothetical protein EHO60_12145 [Leptospira fletcheri]|uniref:Lipoprotein n=1 Tax=Leptospira fletcheri TaxID=2484981 RepID=A0A4R9GBP8_9LEPT|nr:hypothetical protein [Leptospira fletcheri]TGK08795.1 hypothetical protein EHO60_12145 [Leptospira fletcheri]